MKLLFTFLLIVPMLFLSYSQNDENNPRATVTKDESQPRSLLVYLFNKYTIENSELIVLKINKYQNENGVLVLSEVDYLHQIERINFRILNETDLNKIDQLEHEKLKIVNFISIETFILNN